MPTAAFITGLAGCDMTADEASFLRDADPWGVILFRRNIDTPDRVRRLIGEFRSIVGRSDAPVLIDQEAGRVQRLAPPHWRKYPAAAHYGRLLHADPPAGVKAARLVARLMADDMADLGITVDCLPVCDVPQPGSHDVIGDRAYATEPQLVALLARAAAMGLIEGGVLPVIKHIPGHGRAEADSHHGLPVVHASRESLRAIDFLPFAALADLPMAMTAHVVYTALDPAAPATLSSTVIRDVMRHDIGFDGLIMSDDVSMGALSGTLAERTRRAMAAGCDVALHCNGRMDEMVDVAAHCASLSGRAGERAAAALGWLKPPRPYDREEALAMLAGLVPAG